MIKLDNITLDFPVRQSRLSKRSYELHQKQTTGGTVSRDGAGHVSVRALENISFTLNSRDRLALLGHNGAGKTTLLRVMAGIYHPTQGQVSCEGKIAPILSLNFGMDKEATGYENIKMRGLFLGMSQSEIKSKTESIAEFSGLADFLHLPIHTYSSGMRARLAFAISTHVNADILLLDEIVATGDASFVAQAQEHIKKITEATGILVLASHSNNFLRQLCNKGLLLEHGKVAAFGPIDEVIETYNVRCQLQKFELKPPNSASETTVNSDENAPPEPEPTKKILLMNDTGMLPNPGCRAVRKAYKLLFNNHLNQMKVSATIPVNYWIENFRPIAIPGKQTIKNQENCFATGADAADDIDLEQWESTRQEAALKDTNLQNILESVDIVVVNGEGSIHHNSVRGLSILALALTALEAGKKVALINATLQSMMPELLKRVLSRFSFIHVRDNASKSCLAKLNIEACVTPDIAFLALDTESDTKTRLLDASGHVLITGGVLISKESITWLFDAVRNIGMRPVYLSVGNGGENELARTVCSDHNVPMVDSGTLGVKELISFFRQFPLAISGRHHINIYLMRAGVPFLPLPSNTKKIEETLQMVDYPVSPIRSFDKLLPSLQNINQNRATLAEAGLKAFGAGREAASSLIREMKSCL